MRSQDIARLLMRRFPGAFQARHWAQAHIRATVVLALIGVASAAGAVTPVSLGTPGPGVSFPREFFGMHIHNAEKPGHWPDVPFGAWRLWDAYTSWADLEPSKGAWNFARLDAVVDRAQATGVSLLLVLGRTPNWASARPTEHSPYGPGQAAEPANLEDWRNYVRTVAGRYRGRIAAYQIGNEANLAMFWTGGIPKLVELTRVAREEIKRIDPGAQVVAPSGAGLDTSIVWERGFLDAGGAALVDVASFHLYDLNRPPEAMIDRVLAERAHLAAAGYRRLPLWNTETGLLINNIKPALDVTWSDDWRKQRIEPEVASDYVMRAFLIARALGFERYYWYAWDNRWLGMIEPADNSLKAPALAYRHAVAYLQRSSLERCDRDADGLWICRLTMANARPALAMWMDPEAPLRHRTLPNLIPGRVVRFDGRRTVDMQAGTTVDVGADVTLVIGNP
jgi:hypothetical protein